MKLNILHVTIGALIIYGIMYILGIIIPLMTKIVTTLAAL